MSMWHLQHVQLNFYPGSIFWMRDGYCELTSAAAFQGNSNTFMLCYAMLSRLSFLLQNTLYIIILSLVLVRETDDRQ